MDVREKLVELIVKAMPPCYSDVFAAQIADHLIANGVTVQEWISVKDRLPEYGEPVIVCDVREGYVGIAVLQTVKRFVFSKSEDYWDWYRMECQLDEFTHWMPLPQPPKGE